MDPCAPWDPSLPRRLSTLCHQSHQKAILTHKAPTGDSSSSKEKAVANRAAVPVSGWCHMTQVNLKLTFPPVEGALARCLLVIAKCLFFSSWPCLLWRHWVLVPESVFFLWNALICSRVWCNLYCLDILHGLRVTETLGSLPSYRCWLYELRAVALCHTEVHGESRQAHSLTSQGKISGIDPLKSKFPALGVPKE